MELGQVGLKCRRTMSRPEKLQGIDMCFRYSDRSRVGGVQSCHWEGLGWAQEVLILPWLGENLDKACGRVGYGVLEDGDVAFDPAASLVREKGSSDREGNMVRGCRRTCCGKCIVEDEEGHDGGRHGAEARTLAEVDQAELLMSVSAM